MQVIDRCPEIWLSFAICKNEVTFLGIEAFSEDPRRPVGQWNYPTGILALTLPHAQLSEPGAVHGCERNVCPFEMERLTDAQTRLQHEDRDVVQRLRTSGEIQLLLLT